MNSPVTDLTKYRMIHQRPVNVWFRWHEAWQGFILSALSYQFSAQRDFIRQFVQ